MLTVSAPSPSPKYVANASGTGVVVEGDPSGISHATIPTKELLAELNSGGPSLGTHVAATIVGAGPNTISVAPGARFIAARSLGAGTADILKSLELMVAPRGPAGSTVPDVVNNSWGGTSYSWA
jgi:hypothetical protein